MNTDRLVREVEKRLLHLSETDREEVLDAVREEIARERRRLDPGLTVEAERERRLEAEILREILEAINRQARLEDTIEEVLKQLGRIVSFDSCSVALLDGDGRFRIIAARGFADSRRVLGVAFRDPVTEEICARPQTVSIADVQADERFSKIEGTDLIRSWAGIPLLVEGEIIGLLSLDRARVDPFDEEDLHRAKAVAFSAAAAIRKAKLLEQIRRYARLMERVVEVDQAVFAGRPPQVLAQKILEGALAVGRYPGGMLVLAGPAGPQVAAAAGLLAGTEGRVTPPELLVRSTTRFPAEEAARIGRSLGLDLPPLTLYVVPASTSETTVGALALLDEGEGPDDRLMESYASRAATAYLHASRRG